MTVSRVTYNNPGNKTLDNTHTATGIHYKLVVSSAGVLQISLSNCIVGTAVVNTSAPGVASLQLVRSSTTYTLATATFVDAAVNGQEIEFIPSSSVTLPGDSVATDLRKNPFIALQVGDTVQVNLTTAGTGGSVAGTYESNIVIDKASVIV
jgi:hypothetical protein